MSDLAADRVVDDIGRRFAGSVAVGAHRNAGHRLLHDDHRQCRHSGHHPRPHHPPR